MRQHPFFGGGRRVKGLARNPQRFEGTNEKPSLSLLSIGLGTFVSSLLVYAGTDTAFLRYEGVLDFMSVFARIILTSLLVTSMILLILGAFNVRVPSKALVGFGGVLHLLSCASFGYLVLAGPQESLIFYLGAILCGAGECFLALTWGQIFSRFMLRDALLNISIACIISSFVYAAIVLLSPLMGVGLFMLCAAVSAIVPALVSDERKSNQETAKENRKNRKKSWTSFKAFANVIIEPALGLFCFAFVMGLTCYFFYEMFWTYIGAALISSVFLGFLAFLVIKRPLTRLLYQNFIPVLAILVLAMISISQVLFRGFLVDMFFMLLLYTFAAVLTLATLCAIANASEFSSDSIFATALALFAVASLAGLACSEIFTTDMVLVIVTVITTVYAFIMLLVRSIRSGGELVQVSQKEDEPGEISRRCAELADKHGLTAREFEILVYLAQGYSNTYVSEVLFISPNTVRTHIHNLYRKLEAKTREDIIDLTRPQED